MINFRTSQWAATILISLMASFWTLRCSAETELNVMSFNIRYGSANDGPNSWDLRRDTVANAIRNYDPDIVGMQECLLFQAQYLDQALPDYEHFGVGRSGDGSGERMEIFYKTDVLSAIESGNFWLSETPQVPGSRSWNSSNIRMVTWAKFLHHASGETFYFLNTHFDHRSEEARQGAASLLALHIRNNSKDNFVILTGDFNSRAETSVAWKTLTESGLSDSWLKAKKTTGGKNTWSGFKAPEDSVNRIDWILYSGPASVTHCETVLYNENGRYPSDHFPVFARFVFGK